MSTIITPPSNHAFARGHSAVLLAQGMWVRGKASLDTDTGQLRIVLGLETDRLDYGPRGRVTVILRDAARNEVARIRMEQPIAINGKAPGRARIEEFPMSVAVPLDVAARTSSLEASVSYDGRQLSPFGLSLEDMARVFEVILAAA